MSTKIKFIVVATARIALGLIYFVFGLNFFLHFIPTPPASNNVAAEAFTSGLFQSGYFFPMLKGLEVLLGAFLIIGLFVPLSLVMLMPISLNILLFHTLLIPSGAPMGIVIVALHLYLAWSYRGYYQQFWQPKASISL